MADGPVAAAIAPPAQIAALDACAERRFTPSGEGRMVWRLWGRPEATPLVLMHGGYGSWMHWVRVIEPLAERYYVIAPDTPGLGESASPPRPYSPDSIGAIVSQGLDEILPPPRRFHLTGFSFGAMCGSFVCLRQGARAISFTMVGAAAMGLRRAPAEPLGKREVGMTEAEIAAQQRRNLEILMIADPAKVDDQAVYIQTLNTEQARTQSRRFAATADLARALPGVKARLNAVWGDRDSSAYPYFAEREAFVRSLQPDAAFRLLSGVGHWAAYEGAAQFVPMLIELLER